MDTDAAREVATLLEARPSDNIGRSIQNLLAEYITRLNDKIDEARARSVERVE